MDRSTTRIAVIGTGPRGLAVALRLLDDRPHRGGPVELHLIDPAPGGAVWDPRQDAQLLMNSRGRQATVFADGSVPGVAGVSRGPTFIQWCREVAPALGLPGPLARQAAELTELGFASRALFGAYTRWVLAHLLDGDAANREATTNPDTTTSRAATVTVHLHPHRAVDLDELDGGLQRITLDDPANTQIEVDAAVLALGHLAMPPTAREQQRARFAEDHGLSYLAPQQADPHTLEAIAPGQHVAVLGAGLNFYDVMALLTEGRGGRFAPDDSAGGPGFLRYEPSGREPVLHIASGRGIPYMARATEPGLVALSADTEEAFAGWAASPGTVSFSRDVWPVLVAEMARVWSGAGGAGDFDVDALTDPYAAETTPHRPSAMLADTAASDTAASDTASSDTAATDTAATDSPVSADALSAVLRDILARDVASALAVPRGAATAVGEALAVLKDRVRSLVAAGAFDAVSVAGDLQGWFRSVGAFLAAGPPALRVAQAVALLDAGILRARGADARLEMDDAAGVFTVQTRELPEPLPVTAVIEARLPAEDARSSTDPLVISLLARGLARTATLVDSAGQQLATEGLEVVRTTPESLRDGSACRLVAADGTASPRRFLLGLPVQPQEWNIANLPQPDRGDRTLTQAESIAAQLDRLAPARSPVAAHTAV